MKFEPRPKRIKRNTTRSKKFDNDVLSTNYDVIVVRFSPDLEQYESQVLEDSALIINFH